MIFVLWTGLQTGSPIGSKVRNQETGRGFLSYFRQDVLDYFGVFVCFYRGIRRRLGQGLYKYKKYRVCFFEYVHNNLSYVFSHFVLFSKLHRILELAFLTQMGTIKTINKQNKYKNLHLLQERPPFLHYCMIILARNEEHVTVEDLISTITSTV